MEFFAMLQRGFGHNFLDKAQYSHGDHCESEKCTFLRTFELAQQQEGARTVRNFQMILNIFHFLTMEI